jgi:hypothetical protein
LKRVEAISGQARSSGIGRWWEVKIDELKKAKDQRPFQPFRIRMADAREIEIKHPEAVARDERDNPRVAFAISQGEHHWIEVALITSLVSPVPTQPPGGNGGGS